MSYKTNLTEETDGIVIRVDIFPHDICGKIVSMSKDECGIFSRNRLDIWDEVELHALMGNTGNTEKCVVNGVVTNISQTGNGRTPGVQDKDKGTVYTVKINNPSKEWEDLAFQYIMACK